MPINDPKFKKELLKSLGRPVPDDFDEMHSSTPESAPGVNDIPENPTLSGEAGPEYSPELMTEEPFVRGDKTLDRLAPEDTTEEARPVVPQAVPQSPYRPSSKPNYESEFESEKRNQLLERLAQDIRTGGQQIAGAVGGLYGGNVTPVASNKFGSLDEDTIKAITSKRKAKQDFSAEVAQQQMMAEAGDPNSMTTKAARLAASQMLGISPEELAGMTGNQLFAMLPTLKDVVPITVERMKAGVDANKNRAAGSRQSEEDLMWRTAMESAFPQEVAAFKAANPDAWGSMTQKSGDDLRAEWDKNKQRGLKESDYNRDLELTQKLDKIKNGAELRREIKTEPRLKEFYVIQSANKKLQKVPTYSANPQQDMSLIFSYMKMMDPNSTVREGEYASAANTTGIEGRVLNLYNKVMNGGNLTDEQRLNFKSEAKKLYNVHHDQVKVMYNNYAKIASRLKVDIDDLGLSEFDVKAPDVDTSIEIKEPQAGEPAKTKAPKTDTPKAPSTKTVKVRFPTGKVYDVPEEEVDEAVSKGGVVQ